MTERQIAILISVILGIPSLVLSIVATIAQVGSRNDAKKQFEKLEEKGLQVQEAYISMYGDGIILDYASDTELKYFENSGRLISPYPSLNLTITNLSREKTLIVAPFLVGELIDIIRIPENTNFFQPIKEGLGGGGNPDYFECVLSPKQKALFSMPCLDPENKENLKFEYFDLKPLETEYFVVNFDIEPGFLYRYKVGIMYKNDKDQKIHWVNRVFQNGIPVNPFYLN